MHSIDIPIFFSFFGRHLIPSALQQLIMFECSASNLFFRICLLPLKFWNQFTDDLLCCWSELRWVEDCDAGERGKWQPLLHATTADVDECRCVLFGCQFLIQIRSGAGQIAGEVENLQVMRQLYVILFLAALAADSEAVIWQRNSANWLHRHAEPVMGICAADWPEKPVKICIGKSKWKIIAWGHLKTVQFHKSKIRCAHKSMLYKFILLESLIRTLLYIYDLQQHYLK